MEEKALKQIELELESDEIRPERVADLVNIAQELISNLDYGHARVAVIVIQKLLATSEKNLSADVQQNLERLLVLLQFLSLPSQSNEVVTRLFEKYIADVLVDPIIDIDNRLQAKLIMVPLTERDEFKNLLIRYLRQNEQILSKNQIKVDDENRPASVGNVIQEFLNIGGLEDTGVVAQSSYMMRSKFYQKLNQEDREKINQLLKIFQKLSLSSLTPEGYEQVEVFIGPEGKIQVLEQGILSDLDFSKSSLPVQQLSIPQEDQEVEAKQSNASAEKNTDGIKTDILQAYQGDKRFEKKVVKEYRQLEAEVADSAALQEEFFKAVQAKKETRTLAILRLLANRNEFDGLLTANEKLHKFLVATWAKRYGREFAENFHKNATSIEHIRLFLQYVLQERLGMSEPDAAREGLKLAGIFVKAGKNEYNKMAYFDATSKMFKWFGGKDK